VDAVELRESRAHGGFHGPISGQTDWLKVGNEMIGNDNIAHDGASDEAVEKELAGVPEEFLDKRESDDEGHSLEDALSSLRGDLEKAQQDVPYARAEMQNVRRRMEKDVADARAYAATGFARDILSVADNLARALDHVPAELREDDKLKG